MKNEHILKDVWLMYKRPYGIGELRYGSPLIDKGIYDSFEVAIKGVAVELEDGRKFAITKKDFNASKKILGDKYYTNKWKISD